MCDKLEVFGCVIEREGVMARSWREETIEEVAQEIEKDSPSSTVMLVLVVMMIGGKLCCYCMHVCLL